MGPLSTSNVKYVYKLLFGLESLIAKLAINTSVLIKIVWKNIYIESEL